MLTTVVWPVRRVRWARRSDGGTGGLSGGEMDLHPWPRSDVYALRTGGPRFSPITAGSRNDPPVLSDGALAPSSPAPCTTLVLLRDEALRARVADTCSCGGSALQRIPLFPRRMRRSRIVPGAHLPLRQADPRLDRSGTAHPEQADRWTRLIVSAHTQPRRARGLVPDDRLSGPGSRHTMARSCWARRPSSAPAGSRSCSRSSGSGRRRHARTTARGR